MRARVLVGIVPVLGLAILPTMPASGTEPVVRDWTVDGVVRQATVHLPTHPPTNGAPLVFVFHGHGGSMGQAARSFRLHALWPEALVVYPQGLKTPGRLTDPEGRRSGWQHNPGDQGDRDLKFFDAMLDGFAGEPGIDRHRVFATGHSNGGRFTYLLWETRGYQLEAVAPSGAVMSWRMRRRALPKPVLHIAGRTDSLVRFEWQEQTIAWLLEINQCGEGRSWDGQEWCAYHPSDQNAPVATFIHPGGHRLPSGAPAVIVRFFREWSSLDGLGGRPDPH